MERSMRRVKNQRIPIIYQCTIFLVIMLPILYFGRVEYRSNDGEVIYSEGRSMHDVVVEKINNSMFLKR